MATTKKKTTTRKSTSVKTTSGTASRVGKTKRVEATTGIKKQKDRLYYVDKNGNVASVSANRRGGTRGRKVCRK